MNAYREKSLFPVGVLFPETFEDVVCALLTHVPFLQMPCMREFLVARAEFLTLWIVGIHNEYGWDFLRKIKEGENVHMSVSLSDPFTQAENYLRRQMNYAFTDELIAGHARALDPRKKKLLTKK